MILYSSAYTSARRRRSLGVRRLLLAGEMHRSIPARETARPSGTDGSDFSYRMLVDPRYTKVARCKLHLGRLIVAQIFAEAVRVILVGALFLSETTVDVTLLVSIAVSSISLMLGELGCRKSRKGLLKFYVIISSISAVLFIWRSRHVKAFCNLFDLIFKKVEVIEGIYLVVGSLLQVFSVITAISLINNMSSKRAA